MHRGAAERAAPLADSVLRLIWDEREISRAEIARRAGLSRSTVSEAVTALLKTGLVAEEGTGPSSGGRRPIVLRFQDDAACILGVEMGAAHVQVVLTDLRGGVIASREQAHDVREDPAGTRALILKLCEDCLSEGGSSPLLGIGVALPSPVDPRQPDRLSAVVLPAWEGRLGLGELEKRFGVPLMLDNDANLGALAESWWGAGQGVDDFTYVKVATGVGAGHVIGGRIYRGATGVAGEIGHLAIDPHGEPCLCGLRGCLTTLVGAPALRARARALLPEYPRSALVGTEVTIDGIEDAALAGDDLALRVSREAAEHLGIAIAGLLNIMNPSLVVLGGGLSRLGELLLVPLRETVDRRTLVSSVSASDLRTSKLGNQSTAIGGATMILGAALADPRVFPAGIASAQAS
jgi:predicted NBD/HSP70 family sugar kinase